jgi:hypothetical protein
MKRLPIPGNLKKLLPYRSLLSKEIKLPASYFRHYYVLSWGIEIQDLVDPRDPPQRYFGTFKVGTDVRWGGPRSKSGLNPALRRSVRMLEKMGMKSEVGGANSFDRHFWFDVSTRSKPAYYHISTWGGGQIVVELNAKSILNKRTQLPDMKLIKNVEIMDWFIFAVLMNCGVSRSI